MDLPVEAGQTDLLGMVAVTFMVLVVGTIFLIDVLGFYVKRQQRDSKLAHKVRKNQVGVSPVPGCSRDTK